jgi:hypothetical protein
MSEKLVGPDNIEGTGILLLQSKQNGNFDLALAHIRRVIFEYLDGNDVVLIASPTPYHLSECALAKKFKHLIACSR